MCIRDSVLGIKDNPPHGGINKINPEEYNIYSVDIYPDSLVFAVNHRHTYTCLLYTSWLYWWNGKATFPDGYLEAWFLCFYFV